MKLVTFVYEAADKFSPSCFHEFFDVFSQGHKHDTRQASGAGVTSICRATGTYRIH